MNKSYFVGGSPLCMGLLLGRPVSAQIRNEWADSLHGVSHPRCLSDDTHRLKRKEVLIPTAVVGTAAVFVGGGWLTEQREYEDVLPCCAPEGAGVNVCVLF